jgi:hypothetical protein
MTPQDEPQVLVLARVPWQLGRPYSTVHPGCDIAGVVESLGPGVRGLAAPPIRHAARLGTLPPALNPVPRNIGCRPRS